MSNTPAVRLKRGEGRAFKAGGPWIYDNEIGEILGEPADGRITQRMLTKQLRALEEDGLVIRKVYPEVPPRVEYTLSEMGERLRPVIDVLKAWGEDHRARQVADAA